MQVDYSEFLSATLSAQKHGDASILAAFNTLDFDQDGYITRDDVVAALDGQMTESAIVEMLQHADATGKVNFQARLIHSLCSARRTPAHSPARAP